MERQQEKGHEKRTTTQSRRMDGRGWGMDGGERRRARMNEREWRRRREGGGLLFYLICHV